MNETKKTIRTSVGTSVKDSAHSWYGSEPEIRESDITETVYTDILICGGGHGGMVAAIAAGKQGAKTLVIEKNRKVGYFKTYIGAVDTRAQKALGDKAQIDKEEVVDELLRYPTQYGIEEKYIKNRNHVDERLIRLWANESGQAVDFLTDELAEYGVRLAAEYDVGDGYHGKFKAYPVHTKLIVPFLNGGPKVYSHGGIGVVEPLIVKKAKGYGVEFRFNTSLLKLLKEGDKVTGAIARGNKGDFIKILASKGVLLCTGGYATDSELFAKLNPQAASVTTYSYTQPGNVGDGIKAGIWAGGEKERYPSAMLFDRGITKPGGRSGLPFKKSSDFMGGFNAFHFGSQPFLKVNMDGRRFYNESVPYDAILYPLEFEKNGVCCVIWDANFWEHVKHFHTIACSRQIFSTSRPRTYEGIGWLPNTILLTWAKLRGCVQKADSIEELAVKLKLPVDTFKTTVERYNQMAKAGVDEDFGKPAKHIIALNTPPFYGATNAGWVLTTMDGLHINADMQVLDKSGNVIDGLYAAGDAAGGFFACNYYPELVPGVASGKTITFARHAILHMTGAIQKVN